MFKKLDEWMSICGKNKIIPNCIVLYFYAIDKGNANGKSATLKLCSVLLYYYLFSFNVLFYYIIYYLRDTIFGFV